MTSEEFKIKNWPRFWIGIFYLAIVVLSAKISFFYFREVIFFDLDPVHTPKLLLGRIWFILWCGLLGISLRAFKFSRIGRVSPWLPYFIKYPLLVLFESFFVFSVLSLSEDVSSSYLFYTFSLPIMFYFGFGAFETYEEILIGSVKKAVNSAVQRSG